MIECFEDTTEKPDRKLKKNTVNRHWGREYSYRIIVTLVYISIAIIGILGCAVLGVIVYFLFNFIFWLYCNYVANCSKKKIE
jgi:hypothetical protein